MSEQLKASSSLSSISFGDPTAEGDAAFLFDRDCFLHTDLFHRCVALESPLFVVGRRGAGKTAMRMALARHFARDPSKIAVVVAPQNFHFAHAKSLARSMMRDVEVNWEFLFTAVWATVLRSSWAEGLLSYYRVRDTSHEDLDVLRAFVEETVDLASTPEQRVSAYLRQASDIIAAEGKDAVGEIQALLKSAKAERVANALRRVAAESGVRLIAIVDNLDENWDGSNLSAQLISGLLSQCASEFGNTSAVSYVFIRENMYRRVGDLSARWDRIEGYFTYVDWTSEQLAEVILTRIQKSTKVENPGWTSVFVPTIGGIDSLTYMISRTQAKPRELILFCRYAHSSALSHRVKIITEQCIHEAERRYSENRLKDLMNEYMDAVPELGSVIEVFLGEKCVFSSEHLYRNISEFMASGRYTALAPRLSLTHPSPDAIFDLLLGVGFLGVRLVETQEFLFKYYGEQGNSFRSVDEIAEVAIHPAFRVALGIRPQKDGAQELSIREAGDQDLVAASAATGRRTLGANERADQLLATLERIPIGPSGWKAYEELVRDAVSYAFTGYLDNARMQERNWAGTQIRDVVFDNTGESLFFNHARDRFKAVTFVFECKNKDSLEPGDFHQIEARLSDSTGNLGFICYRNARSEPLRQEIEHIRSIFHRSHSTKVIMLISDPNFALILSKRLKGRLDKFMYATLTRYLTLYLSS